MSPKYDKFGARAAFETGSGTSLSLPPEPPRRTRNRACFALAVLDQGAAGEAPCARWTAIMSLRMT